MSHHLDVLKAKQDIARRAHNEAYDKLKATREAWRRADLDYAAATLAVGRCEAREDKS